MATIVFSYDEYNPIAHKTLDFLKSLGVFKIQKKIFEYKRKFVSLRQNFRLWKNILML
jgi:hypothetical protein